MGKKTVGSGLAFYGIALIGFLLIIFPFNGTFAEKSQCARVKIEIKQELTLERQAFDAHMRINNGLTHTPLEDIRVEVWFTDESGDAILASSDPNNTDSLFFIRLDEMTNIDNVSGTGSVPVDSSADIHWLIIPAPGASNGLEKGTLYNVGATLTYTVGGEKNIIEVNPDYIFVKPMPELTLDYFLPTDVYGDDPFTTEIEPSIPFSLGVRVKNTGAGGAQNLKIDSAQPKIVDNEQGLLINFYIQGSEINGEETVESLLVDFGTIEPGATSIARWLMNCTLSGRFVEFKAQYSHADELGGELTSLIDGINTHNLVQDVLVDLPGRDGIRDFLSKAGDIYTVYESDSQETEVTDLSASSTLVFKKNIGTESHYTLSMTVSSGFIYTKLSDPNNGGKYLKSITRSDGKNINKENGWLSKTQDRDTHNWDHFINLFDANSTGTYTVVFDSLTSVPQEPVLQFISDKAVIENHQISFIVEASDPNGTTPALSAAPLPAGARFIDNGDGTGVFDWTPAQGQKGLYYITFSASNDALSTSRRVKFTVYDINDTDMDGMLDDWEILYFGVLARDGSGDFDGDGISDLQEFLDNTDPTLDESAPSTPDPLYPHPNVDVSEPAPELVISNSTDTQNDFINYEFEIYSDLQMTNLVANQGDVAQIFNTKNLFMFPYTMVADDGDSAVPQVESTTNWQVPVTLSDNARYYWRVRSSDQQGSSLWAYESFFVNTQNDPPSAFSINSPDDASQVDTLTPQLSVINSTDIDNDVITYFFEIYADQEMSQFVAGSSEISQEKATTSWTVNTPLSDQTLYFWRAIASDTFGAQTTTPLSSFYVNTTNQAPSSPMIQSPDGSVEIEAYDVMLGVENSTDSNLDPLVYMFEIDTSEKFDSPDKQVSEEIIEGPDTTWWQVSNLQENQTYYWRVKASDGSAQSMWSRASFSVNHINDAPTMPTLKNPGENSWVDTRTPVLSLHPALDPDNDEIEYRFEVYSNDTLTRFVFQGESSDPDWTVPVNLRNNTRYYWRAQALDEHGVPSAWTPVSDFFVNIDLINQVPEIEIIEPFEDLYTRDQAVTIRWIDADPDSSAVISLYYDTDNQGEDGILIVEDMEEDLDSDQDSYTWDVSALDDGVYYIYALIRDEDNDVYRYAPIKITIDRTPPVLSISPEPGNYDDPVFIEITTNEPAQVFYTLDGTEPGMNAVSYAGPIEINESTTLKCMARDLTGNETTVITQEYLFNLESITLNVATDSNEPVTNTNVYIFTKSGSYYGQSGKTDAQGNALFDPEVVEPGSYKFRVDYLGHQFWSDPVLLPDNLYTEFIIPVQTVTVNVTTANSAVSGDRVYLFSESGSYLGQYRVTDEQGNVSFDLPVGVSYKFRADVLGTQYWTEPAPVQGSGTNEQILETGGGLFTVTLQKDAQHPIPGIKLYLFNSSGSYLGKMTATNENGQVSFEVPEAGYKVRADYMGYQFWTGEILVASDTSIDLTLPHKNVTIDVLSVYQETSEPIVNVEAYLFNSSGSYLGKTQTTDMSGQAFFSLPDKPYKIRVDYMEQQFWSQEFTGQDTSVNIASAVAQVSVSGAGLPQAGLNVYLFSETGSYLGQNPETDAAGQVLFRLPEGKYTFRVDYENSQFWSPLAALAPNLINPVDVSVGGGRFTFTAQTDTGTPIAGSKCFVFTEDYSYIGLFGATDANGEMPFDLADGTYLFRFDYMGQQFWSDPVTVPDQLAYQMTLFHEIVQVTVGTKNNTVSDCNVYLFSENNSYIGQYQVTDNNGVVSFFLPVGENYRFRADILGSQQWSDVVQITDTGINSVFLNAGGGLLTAKLQTDALSLITGIKMYLFTENGSYTGVCKTTDDTGQVSFEIPNARYKIRADYRSCQFWTDALTVSDDISIDQTLAHGTAQVNVLESNTPVPGVNVYLFNANDSYLEKYVTTDADGIAQFLLPEGCGYKFRADVNNSQYWSGAVNIIPYQENPVQVEITQ